MNKICLIGAGRIAYSFAAALIEGGYNVASVCSRRIQSAEKMAALLNIPHHTSSLSEIPADTELCFLAVPDSEIRKTAELLAGGDFEFENMLFVHLSGSLDSHQLDSLKDKGASVASFHIMQTFPSLERVLVKGCYAAVESPVSSTKEFLFTLARRLSIIPFGVDSDKKSLYHISGVFASNFLVASLYNAQLAFEGAGIQGVEFTSLMKPIIKSTLDNVLNSGVLCSLSGPVKRGDYQTIVQHFEALSGEYTQTAPGSAPAAPVILNYVISSLTLLELVERSDGSLNEGQKRIREYLSLKLKNLL